ncbi:hypothetical protein JCGZ_03613 [Jatropha curcas]|uniref:Prokaryotic-type class I peptide chain release factors domain-containing protein n=1 Tax=Jatropha curcas TaxID=180498 RepID=A0A067KY81_JATCU|nr:hypothetical protein JCGZ_03613 [Jatropha curcas]
MAAQLALKSVLLFKLAGRNTSYGGTVSNYCYSFYNKAIVTTTTRKPEFQQGQLRCFTTSNEQGKRYLELSDEELMRQCEMDTFKASGPGGQHRNKRESAVRIKHLPTGVISQAVEDRSQHKNRASALRRLRTHLALKEAAKLLGLSTGALSRLLLSDDSLRMAVNDLRTSKGNLL